MGNNNSQPKMTIRARGRGPIPPALLNLQNGVEYGGIPTSTVVTTQSAMPPMMPMGMPMGMPTYPVGGPVMAPPVMATATTTDTVISGPMLPPRLPPVPVIEHPMQPGIYGATQVGPSTYETQIFSQAPFVANQPFLEETTITHHATAPPQPSPQPSPPVTYQQQQLQQMPPLPAGYANQMEYYQGNAAYASDNEDEDDTASYTSFEEEVYVMPTRRDLAPPVYSRRSSPNFAPTFIRESPPPYSTRDSPPPSGLSGIPLSARTRSAISYAESPYERYGRSRAFERYQERVNSRMSSYDQMPDQYGFYPNAYRI